jgi:hypothetical protein
VKTVRGYHLVNGTPIKEAVWEGILASSLNASGVEFTWNSGGHQSGRDIVLMDGVRRVGVSCKSCKDTTRKTHLQLSSYRMTKCRGIEDFVRCIDIERANFDYYGILARVETDEAFRYSVHFIPSDLVKASSLKWTEKYSQRNDNAEIASWVTDEVSGVQMNIVKAMSNQLWIKLRKEAFKEHCILDGVEIKRDKVIDYATLCEMLLENK